MTSAGRFPPKELVKAHAGWLTPTLLAAIVVVAILASLCIGVYSVPLDHVAEIIGALASPFPIPEHPPWTIKEQVVVQVVRLPRVMIATMAGLGLGLSGAALQGMMRNPLVSPDSGWRDFWRSLRRRPRHAL